MSKKFYVFYDDMGTINSVGRVCEEENVNELEVEREVALQFLQGKENPRKYRVIIKNNHAELVKLQDQPTEEANSYSNPGFVRLEEFHDDDDPDLTIIYYKATETLIIESRAPFSSDTHFYITPRNNPVEIISHVVCDRGSTIKELFCNTDLISIISWRQTGNKILYMEF